MNQINVVKFFYIIYKAVLLSLVISKYYDSDLLWSILIYVEIVEKMIVVFFIYIIYSG